MSNIILNFALAHREYFLGLACGYAVAHIPEAVAFVFHQAMRIPWLRAAVVANPAKAKALIDAIQTELDKDIDAESAAAAPAAVPAAQPPVAH